jgi:hypothetical protein
LQSKAEQLQHRLAKRYRRTGEPQRSFSSFLYRAHPGSHQLRICYKAEQAEAGTILRFLVTNLSGRSASVFPFYNDRGEHCRVSRLFTFQRYLVLRYGRSHFAGVQALNVRGVYRRDHVEVRVPGLDTAIAVRWGG